MIFVIDIGKRLLNILYFFIKLLPTRHKVTMISRQSDTPSFEFLMIREALKKEDPDLEVVILCHTLDGGVKSTLWTRVKYGFHMLRQMVEIATSKVVLLDTYCIVISLLHQKKDLTVIQMWHSMGTMKKFGYTALDTEEGTSHELAYAMQMHENYDYVFASSEAYKDHLAAGFHCDRDKIVTMPLPRADLLRSQEYAASIRKRIYARYPTLKEKPVILYCPTFRKDEADFENALQKLMQDVDPEKYNLVVKLHPLSKIRLADPQMSGEGFSSFEMLFVADYVISDYSCIVYEAAMLDIPLYFYNFDMDLYEGDRGLAIDYYKELPGVISGDAKEILVAIDETQKDPKAYDHQKLKAFADKYVAQTEHATKDIADFVERFL